MNQTLPSTNFKRKLNIFDKRLVTNFIATVLVIFGLNISEPWSDFFLNTGLFALSGAITNWLAIYMLFEKVPGIFGSGVVPLNFESFKKSIHELVMNQFFNRKNVEQFFLESENSKIIPDFDKVFKRVNFNPAFDSLLEVIKSSNFGPMLSMIGGIQSLSPLREPFIEKLKFSVHKISETDQFKDLIREQLSDYSASDEILEKVNEIVGKRLEELTPNMVKEIVERMIQEHLGWLVVWGGIFGGFIGILSTYII